MNLREFAKGQDCAVRFPGCHNDTSTVVLAHLPAKELSGMGMKAPDICAVHACYFCHNLIDGRDMTATQRALRDELREFGDWWEYLYLGLMRTVARVWEAQRKGA